MSRAVVAVLVLVAFGVGAAVGALALTWSTGGLAEESTDPADAAPTLSLDDATPTPNDARRLGTQIAEVNTRLDAIATRLDEPDPAVTQIAALDARLNEINQRMGALNVPPSVITATSLPATATPTLTPTATPTSEPEATEEVSASNGGDALSGRSLFRLKVEDDGDGEVSEARFYIDEELGGQPTTVVGTTSRLAGDIIVNFSDPPASQVGEIVINARTLRTDNDFRNQAIRGPILQTGEHEFIRFEPTGLIALTDAPPAPGDTLNFEVRGDLTVRDVTREVTFATEVTVVDATRLEGLARTTILWEDFDITINAPPLVANISDDVILEIDFIALEVEE